MSGQVVSVILPVFNEAAILERTVRSLLEQQTDGHELEILVVDGYSTDGSRAIVERLAQQDRRVRLLTNERRKTPFALNLGLRAARGDYVCILGAHCHYDRDYISVCLQEMLRHGAAGCSGKVLTRTGGESFQARLSSWALGHPFGVSGRSFRTQPEGYADTIPYPVFRKQVLLELGGYDETMTRNQDNAMNYRIRQAGHKLYCTWKTTCTYFAKSSLRGLLDYALSNGGWCAVSFRKEPRSLGLRHYMPALFVAAVVAGGAAWLAEWWLTGRASWLGWLGMVPLVSHVLIGTVCGLRLAWRERRLMALWMPVVFLAFHLTYGWAFWAGLLRHPSKVQPGLRAAVTGNS
jgi:GT2 family glycosyltransferase